MYKYNKLLISLIIACSFCIVGIWELYVLFLYQKNKNNNEYSAYIYTIFKSIFNILFSIFIFYKLSNKFLNFLIIQIIIVLNVCLLGLFCNLKHYDFFVKVIIVEFIILNIQSNILLLLGLYYIILWIKPNQVIVNNTIDIIIDIPYAIPNNLDISDEQYLPQAIELK